MVQHFYAKEIGIYLRDQLKTAMVAALGEDGIKIVMYGDIRWAAQEQDFAKRIPGLFIATKRIRNRIVSLYQHYESEYELRIVYVDHIKKGFTSADDCHEDNALRVLLVADSMIENILLNEPTNLQDDLTRAQVLALEIPDIDLDPPESQYIPGLHTDVLAAAITVRVTLEMWKEVP